MSATMTGQMQRFELRSTSRASAPRRQREPRMSTEEVAREFEWLLSFGTHPDLAVQQLGTNKGALQQRLNRHGYRVLASRLDTTAAEPVLGGVK